MTVTYMFKGSRNGTEGASGADAGVLMLPVEGAAPRIEAPASELPEAGKAGDPPAEAAPRNVPAISETRNLPVKWSPPESRLILVGKSRGGVGATSVAINLALELQNARRLFGASRANRVALVDFDVQFGNVGSFLDLDDRGGMLALLRLRDEPDAQAVRNAMLTHPSGLRVLVAPRSPIPLEALDSARVEAILAVLMAEYDYIVADLPPALVPWLEPLIARASQLLLVSDLSVPSVACTRRVLDLMREDNPDLATDIVVSREKKPMILRKTHREAAKAIGLPLAHWLPDESRLARQALDRGEPLSLLAPRCAWTKALREIAGSIRAQRRVEAKV
jgi:Flp pilus assembly CpaE family ATPase